MSRVADRAVREQALDWERSFIVRAPAGSGKTGLLIQRYLALLARVDHPEEVVAITFTIKAAAEMRNRVVEALESARGEPPLGAYERSTFELARRALARDDERDWRIAAQPSRLRIQTIDALCLSLVRQMAWSSRLGAEVRLVASAGDHYRAAAREVLALLEDTASEWRAPIATLLAHLDNDVPRFEAVLVSMLAHRDHWLRHVQPDAGAGKTRRHRLEAGLALAVRDELAVLGASLPDALGQAVTANEGRELPGLRPEDLAGWQAIAEALLTKTGKPRVRPGAANRHSKRPHVDDGAARESLAERLRAAPDFVKRLHRVRSLPPLAYGDAQWRVLDALCDVLRVAAAMLRVVFAERGEIDIIELVTAARTALGEPQSPTDLALAVDYRIGHILVDEFQDTSHAQVELLARLTAGWVPGDGRTLFLVGDPAQSIYRFREADVGLYLDIRERGLGDIRLTPLSLESNFRSQSGIVDWVNEVFPRVLAGRDDRGSGAVSYRPSSAHRGPGTMPAATVHPFVGDDGRDEAAGVLAIVRDALRERPGQRIAVLVRARSHLSPILPALRRAGVRYRGVDIDPLAAMPVVEDLLSLTRALTSAADRVAWLAVLRAPWCGLTLADLEALAGGDRDRLVLDQMRDAGACARLGADGRARVEKLIEALRPALAARGRVPTRRLVEGAWLRLGGPALVPGPELANADTFLHLLEDLDREPGATPIERLLTRISERFAASAVPEPELEIMTVHNAKGLEFDTVIVPGLGRGTPAESRRVLEWSERCDASDGAGLLMAPVPARGDGEDRIYRYLRELEAERVIHESARLLYVAATRARERLHLLGTVRRSASGKVARPQRDTLLARLWPVVRDCFEAADGGAAEPPTGQLELKLGADRAFIKRLPVGWTCPPPPAGVPGAAATPEVWSGEVVEFEWAGVSARHIGTVVHRMLQRVAGEGLGAWNEGRLAGRRAHWRAALHGLGVPRAELESAVGAVESAVAAVLRDERARWLFDPSHEDAHNEYALSGVIDAELTTVVLDRTFLDATGTRWVVDYKTGRHEGADLDAFLDREQLRYRDQLGRYAALMGALEGRPVRLGLYFPMHCGWREWSAAGTPA